MGYYQTQKISKSDQTNFPTKIFSKSRFRSFYTFEHALTHCRTPVPFGHRRSITTLEEALIRQREALANYTAFLYLQKRSGKFCPGICLSIYLLVREYIFNFLSANVGELRYRFTSGLVSDVDDVLKVCKFGLFFRNFISKCFKKCKIRQKRLFSMVFTI